MRIKFCGITRADDAAQAISLGVDALGFVFYSASPRYVEVGRAASIIRELPPFVTTVGLFVNASANDIERVIETTRIDVVQFHGDETAADCAKVSRPWIKALRVRPDSDLVAAQNDYHGAQALLLDAYDPTVYGGSGKVFDWSAIPQDLTRPYILAGGLTAANVARAIRATRPYAVDVSGGIEASKGIKDINKMTEFIAEVKQLESQP